MDLTRILATAAPGAAAMGVTTALEMRLRGRPACDVPAQALARVPRLKGAPSATRR